MVEEQKYPYLTWRLAVGVASKNLKFLKIVEWYLIKLIVDCSRKSIASAVYVLSLPVTLCVCGERTVHSLSWHQFIGSLRLPV
jgi:hypothetical protein